ncbi:MAG: HD domain-containing protein [Candidatus Woykebacteria bacterium]
MEAFIDFFLEVGKLKTIKRRGWVLRGIKKPESVADHAFRVLILAWVFGRNSRLNVKRLLKLGLVHSLSAVHIDYISPYDKLLAIKSKKELLKKYPALELRAPVTEKGRIITQRFKEEEKAVKQLFNNLPDLTKNELISLWYDFQNKTSKEAKALKVLDRIENLIQALEYKNELSKELIEPFLYQVSEITDDKNILNFAVSVEEYFLKGAPKKAKNRKNVRLIEFLTSIGKLKTIKRIGWMYGGAKEGDTESVAAHSFRLALMAWILRGRRRFDVEKLIKMSLVHDFVTVYAGDTTPFDDLITKDLKKDKSILEVWPTRTGDEKRHLTVERRHAEKKALDKILKYLPIDFQDEVRSLWFEYEEGFSKEGRLVRQVDRIEKLLQAIVYKNEGIYKPSIDPYWVQLKTLVDDSVLIDFVENVDKWYYGGKQASKSVDKARLTK